MAAYRQPYVMWDPTVSRHVGTDVSSPIIRCGTAWVEGVHVTCTLPNIRQGTRLTPPKGSNTVR